MTTDTPSNRDEEIPTPRCEKAKVGASWIIASHSAGDFIPCELGEELERDLIRLSRWRDEHLRIMGVADEHFREARAQVAHLLEDKECGIQGIVDTLARLSAEREKEGLVANRDVPTLFPTLQSEIKSLRATLAERDKELAEAQRKLKVVAKAVDIAEQINNASSEMQVALSASFEEAIAHITLEQVEKERDELREQVEYLAKRREELTEEYCKAFESLQGRDKELAEAKWEQKVLKEMVFNRSEELDKLETDVQAICRKSINAQREQEVRELTAQLLAAQTVNGKMREALNLAAVYLRAGGVDDIADKADEALASSPDPTLLDEVVEGVKYLRKQFHDWDAGSYIHVAANLRDEWYKVADDLLSRLRQSTEEKV